jgi:hypothetical protein
VSSRDDPEALFHPEVSATSRWTIPSILTLCSRNRLIILVLVSFALTPLLVPL